MNENHLRERFGLETFGIYSWERRILEHLLAWEQAGQPAEFPRVTVHGAPFSGLRAQFRVVNGVWEDRYQVRYAQFTPWKTTTPEDLENQILEAVRSRRFTSCTKCGQTLGTHGPDYLCRSCWKSETED